MLKIKPKCCLKQNKTPARNTYSRTRHQSGTLLAEPDTCLEHYLDSNNTYTNYSSGQPISADALPLSPPPVTIHFRLNFGHFLPEPLPPSTGCHKCMAPYLHIYIQYNTSIYRSHVSKAACHINCTLRKVMSNLMLVVAQIPSSHRLSPVTDCFQSRL